MTLKSRKKAAKSRAPKSDVKRVRDAAVLKRGPQSPNTSAFKTPARIPVRLEKLDVPARKRLAKKLIPQPEPAPLPAPSVCLTKPWTPGC